jgi:hypothetical protein
VHLVALPEQELGEIRAVLAGHARDECPSVPHADAEPKGSDSLRSPVLPSDTRPLR